MFTRRLVDPLVAGTEHEVIELIHRRETDTTVLVVDHGGDEVERHTSLHETEQRLGMTFEQAEQLVMQLPEYAEVETEQSLVERMRALLTPEQLAELGLGE